MKFFALATLLVSSQAFATKCPPLLRSPKQVVCQTNASSYGVAMSKSLVINLADNGQGMWVGSTDFLYPGIGNGDGSPNTIKAEVVIETHGNGACQQYNTTNIALNMLSYNLTNLGKSTSMTTRDEFGNVALSLNMSCTLR